MRLLFAHTLFDIQTVTLLEPLYPDKIPTNRHNEGHSMAGITVNSKFGLNLITNDLYQDTKLRKQVN